MRKLYEPYPQAITIDGTEYPVRTDFRDWLIFADILQDTDITEEERIKGMLGIYEGFPPDVEQAIIGAMSFYTVREEKEIRDLFRKNKEDKEKETKKETEAKKKLWDWTFDAEAIQASFMHAYGIDLEEILYLHWHKFRALFDYLPSDTEIKQRISYRNTNAAKIKDKTERERILKIQKAIRLPSPRPEIADIGNTLW